MKVAFDEHVPSRVLRALEPLLEDERNGRIELVSASDYRDGKPAKSDVPWLEAFARDGGKVVISGDKAMRRKPHERKALLDNGFIVFFLPSSWCKAPLNEKAAYIMQWWSVIFGMAKASKPPKQYQLPNSTNTTSKVRDATGQAKKR